MFPIEVRHRRNEVWKARVAAEFIFIMLILVLDHLSLAFWIVAAGVTISLVFTVHRAYNPEPLIVINDEGMFDRRRLGVGVIRLEDICRIKLECYNRVFISSRSNFTIGKPTVQIR